MRGPLLSTTMMLVNAAKDGDVSAVRDLSERYWFVGKSWLDMMGIPRSVVPEDVLADVFEDLLNRPDKIESFENRGPRSFRRFFYVVLRTRFYMHLRTEKRQRELENRFAEEMHDDDTPTDQENRLWYMNLIRRALQDWLRVAETEAQRRMAKLFGLIYLDGKRVGEAGDELSITRNQASDMHRRGKTQIRRRVLELLREEVSSDEDFMDEVATLYRSTAMTWDGDCPNEAMLRSLLHGKLDPDDASEIAHHVSECHICSCRADYMRGHPSKYGTIPPPE